MMRTLGSSSRGTSRGFTIVELLIVIVVIAILATITIVAFNGIQDRAKASAAQSSAAQATKKAMAYAVENADTYPADLAAIGISNSGDTTYQYSVNNSVPRTFCITATKANVSYFSTESQSSPVAGACAGHALNGVPATINYALNPSAETNATSSLVEMGGANTDSSRTRVTSWAANGTASVLITKTVATGTPKGLRVSMDQPTVAGDVLRWSFVVRNNTASAKSFQAYGERSSPTYQAINGGSGCQSVAAGATLTITGQSTITSTNEGLIGPGVLPCSSFLVNESYNVDSYMVTINQALPSTFFDGTSSNWVWIGTPHLSRSTGPAS